jgi:hypothetical protein
MIHHDFAKDWEKTKVIAEIYINIYQGQRPASVKGIQITKAKQPT